MNANDPNFITALLKGEIHDTSQKTERFSKRTLLNLS
jgi:hypothetical protein